MILDCIVIGIIVISMVIGYRQGFIDSVITSLGWILAIVFSFIWFSDVARLVKEKTDFYIYLHEKVSNKVDFGLGEDSLGNLPEIISDAIRSAAENASILLSARFTDTIFHIIMFVVILLAFRILIGIVASFLNTAAEVSGIIGALNHLSGFAIGAVKGVIIVFVALALVTAYVGVTESETVITAISNSPVTNYLYKNNLIFWVIQDFL